MRGEQMTIMAKCNACGHDIAVVKPTSIHIGAYCSSCGKWIKWLNKNEKRSLNIVAVTVNTSNEPTLLQTDDLPSIHDIIDNEVPW